MKRGSVYGLIIMVISVLLFSYRLVHSSSIYCAADASLTSQSCENFCWNACAVMIMVENDPTPVTDQDVIADWAIHDDYGQICVEVGWQLYCGPGELCNDYYCYETECKCCKNRCDTAYGGPEYDPTREGIKQILSHYSGLTSSHVTSSISWSEVLDNICTDHQAFIMEVHNGDWYHFVVINGASADINNNQYSNEIVYILDPSPPGEGTTLWRYYDYLTQGSPPLWYHTLHNIY